MLVRIWSSFICEHTRADDTGTFPVDSAVLVRDPEYISLQSLSPGWSRPRESDSFTCHFFVPIRSFVTVSRRPYPSMVSICNGHLRLGITTQRCERMVHQSLCLISLDRSSNASCIHEPKHMLRRPVAMERRQIVVSPERFLVILWECVVAEEVHLRQQKYRILVSVLRSVLQQLCRFRQRLAELPFRGARVEVIVLWRCVHEQEGKRFLGVV